MRAPPRAGLFSICSHLRHASPQVHAREAREPPLFWEAMAAPAQDRATTAASAFEASPDKPILIKVEADVRCAVTEPL